jgi:hypothetical protein
MHTARILFGPGAPRSQSSIDEVGGALALLAIILAVVQTRFGMHRPSPRTASEKVQLASVDEDRR